MTKDSVLAILKQSGGYISGELISQRLGVSRAAINAAVQQLRAEGYDIASTTNKGYRLSGSPDILNAGELMALLSEQRMKSVLCLASVDSTNKLLREMAIGGAPEGQIVLANEQTAGRGRLGRSFASPSGKGIYLSMLLRPTGQPAESSMLTAWAAVAACRAIERVCALQPDIKWVNDLVLGNKKLCGILTEMSLEAESGHIQYIVIGIGVNVNETSEDFPVELRQTATSLLMESNSTVPLPRAKLAAALIEELDRLRESWPQARQEYLNEYRKHCLTVGRDVCVISGGGRRSGRALAVNDDFSLAVQYDGGETAKLSSGEVSVRGLYGYV